MIGSIWIIVRAGNFRNNAIQATNNWVSTNECIVFRIQNQAVIKYKRIISLYKHHISHKYGHKIKYF